MICVRLVADEVLSVTDLGVLEVKVGANRPPRSLGMWAVLTGVVTAEQLQEAYAGWDERGEAPGEMFVRRGWMTEQMVADALGELSGLPVVGAAKRSDDPDVLGALSADEACLLEACPLERDRQGNLVVALADPSDARLRALKAQLGSVRPVIVVNSELKALLEGMQAAEATPGAAAPSKTAEAENGGEEDIEAHDPPASPEVEAATSEVEAASPEVEAAERPDDAPEHVDSAPVTLEPDEDAEAATEQLERLHERLVSEHVQASDELVAHRRRFTEFDGEQARLEKKHVRLEEEQAQLAEKQAQLAEEQAQLAEEQAQLAEEQERVQRSVSALEAKLGEEELVLSLIKARLKAPK